MKHVTLPIPPWDIEPITEAVLIGEAVPKAVDGIELPVDEKFIPTLKPTAVANLAGRAFAGRLNISDLDYMAKAILQMLDENCELRERIRRLEEKAGMN